VNLILFTPAETAAPLPRTDPRAVHLIEVLRRKPADTFDAGLIDGPRGKGTVVSIDDSGLSLRFTWGDPPPPLDPITLVIGLPRPQTARKILQEATSLGVRALHFVATERGEASYAQSTLWSSGEWRRHLIQGAEQAFCTRLPEVTWRQSLNDALATSARGGSAQTRIAFDNYESPESLSRTVLASPLLLVFGAERGWTALERELLRARGCTFAHLGPRVLRTETAVVSAVAIAKARLALI
jgi:16S rRNA (uracil1498-N3)-methyltransferase